MSKNLYNNGSSGSKSLYGIDNSGTISASMVASILAASANSSVTTDQFGAVASDGNKVFGVLSADTMTGNVTAVIQKLTVGTGGLLQIIPTDQVKINDALTYGVLITTNNHNTGADTGYTGVKINVPYIFNEPDHAPVAALSEAPDNFLDISNTKFRVSGPFTFVKSVKTSFKGPLLTLGYYDREEASFVGSTTLELKKYDKGIIMERIENNSGLLSDVKFSYMGYSQNLGRFVMYNDGVYTGTDRYYYTNKDGTLSSDQGVLTEYNVGRNPNADSTNPSTLEVDRIYTNHIVASDHTGSRSLVLNSYDTMTIGVNRFPGDTNPNRNFDLLLDVSGKIIVTSAGSQGTVQYSEHDYRIQSKTGTYINYADPSDPNYKNVPVFIGNKSTTIIDNYLQTTYISTGVLTRNGDTMVEIGGDFVAETGLGADSKLLVDGSITGHQTDNIHNIYSKPTIYVPTNSSINYVSNTTLQPSNLVLNSGSSVNTSSTLHLVGATSNATNNYSLLSSAGEIRFLGSPSTGAYMSWANDALNLYNAHIYINPQAGSTVPYLEIGTLGSKTDVYAIRRFNVDGSLQELFVDGISTQVPLLDNTSFTVTGTVEGYQTSGKIGSFKFEYCLTVNNGIKSEKWYNLNIIYCDEDSSGYIYDFMVSYSGDPVNFVSGDAITFKGTNTNSTNTNWFANLFVTSLTNA